MTDYTVMTVDQLKALLPTLTDYSDRLAVRREILLRRVGEGTPLPPRAVSS